MCWCVRCGESGQAAGRRQAGHKLIIVNLLLRFIGFTDEIGCECSARELRPPDFSLTDLNHSKAGDDEAKKASRAERRDEECSDVSL